MLVALCAVGCAVLGLLVGSFLNVVVARVPAGQSVVHPPSRCPRCAVPIAPRDNVPVLSWLLLRGRSRCCGLPISARYPLVEAGTAVAFGLVAAWVLASSADPSWPLRGAQFPDPAVVLALLAFLYLMGVTIPLSLIDIDVFRLPVVIVTPSYPVAAVLLGGSALLSGAPGALLRAGLAGAVLFAGYWLLNRFYPAGMGYGDVRLSGLLGLYLGWLGWDVLVTGAFLGFFVGAVGGLALMAVQRRGLKAKIPFGPYMFVGAWLGLLVGHPIAQAYLRGAGLA